MKKFGLIFALVTALFVVAAPAHAGGKFQKKESWVCSNFPGFCNRISFVFLEGNITNKKKYKKKIKKKFAKKYLGSVKKVPEIDAAGAAIALALLAGAFGIRRELKARRA